MDVKISTPEEKQFVLTGSKATKHDSEYYQRFRKIMGIKDDDPHWPFFVSLHSFSKDFFALPEELERIGKRIINDVDRRTNGLIVQKANEHKADLARTLEIRADKLLEAAEINAKSDKYQWLCFTLLLLSLVMAIVFWLGRVYGVNTGYALAQKELMQDEKFGAWASTPYGQKAYKMLENGDLPHILDCSRPGWKKSTTRTGAAICLPSDDPNGFGWYLP